MGGGPLPSATLRWPSSLPRYRWQCLLPHISCSGARAAETFWVEVVDELVAEFRKKEDRWLHLEKPDVRVCDLILGPPSIGLGWPTGWRTPPGGSGRNMPHDRKQT
jgi:hypothetical protein